MIEASYGPLKGMPDRLPEGEFLIWQGRPAWWSLVWRAFHVRAIAGYFAVLLAWRLVAGFSAGGAKNTVLLLAVSLAAIAIVGALAWLYSITTVYSITNRRIVMHIGIALPVALNLPFSQIGAVSARVYPNGTADIPLTLLGDGRLGYLHLWPHVRPWRLSHPEPMLRCVPDGERIANLLAKELKAAQPEHAVSLGPQAVVTNLPQHVAPVAA
jgi:PH (Pleckstrin Homology) domain-containing protein